MKHEEGNINEEDVIILRCRANNKELIMKRCLEMNDSKTYESKSIS